MHLVGKTAVLYDRDMTIGNNIATPPIASGGAVYHKVASHRINAPGWRVLTDYVVR